MNGNQILNGLVGFKSVRQLRELFSTLYRLSHFPSLCHGRRDPSRCVAQEVGLPEDYVIKLKQVTSGLFYLCRSVESTVAARYKGFQNWP